MVRRGGGLGQWGGSQYGEGTAAGSRAVGTPANNFEHVQVVVTWGLPCEQTD